MGDGLNGNLLADIGCAFGMVRRREPIPHRLAPNRSARKGDDGASQPPLLAILFSGICGQGGIVGGGLMVLAQRRADTEMTLALGLLFVICAQFFAALGLTRALLVPRPAGACGALSPLQLGR